MITTARCLMWTRSDRRCRRRKTDRFRYTGSPPVSPEKESEVKDVPGPSTSPDTSKPEKKPSVKKQKSEPARIIKPAKIVLPLKPAKKEPTPESVLKETEAQKPKASAVKPTDVTDERKGPDSPERQPVEDKPMAAKATPEVSSAPETGAVTDENAETDAEKADDGQQKPELSQEQSSAESEEQKTSKKKKKNGNPFGQDCEESRSSSTGKYSENKG